MSRRLLTAGLSLAVLLGAQAGFGRVAAKPPDLPLVENDVLVSSPLLADESDAPFPTPATDILSLLQLRPSVRRTVASCILFGVHPLLALAPTEDYLDAHEDDGASATVYALFERLTTQEGPADSLEEQKDGPCGFKPSVFITGVGDADAPTNDLNIPIAPNTIIRNVPSYGPGAAAPSVCPYMRQQQCPPDRQAALFTDPNLSRDVLQNLKALRQSRELLEKARQLGRDGRVVEALDTLTSAADLCPGGRFDEEIKTATADVLSRQGWAEREIAQKLLQPVTLNFTNAPLRQVIDDLRGWETVNIYIDQAALDADEISLERAVSIKVENIPLKSALKQILKQAHLMYIVKDSVVCITTERSVRATIQPSLPPVDASVPAALDQVLYETLKVGLAAAGESEEQEAPVVAPPHGWMEFGVGLDGSFRMFTQFERGGAVWHVEYNERGLTWWASPDGGANKE